MSLCERQTFKTTRGYTYSYLYSPAKVSTKTTLLFLHGFPSHADDWALQLSYFSENGHGVIAPDLLGYGRSSKPDGVDCYTFKGMSDDIAQLLDHLQVTSVIGVGHDFGANFLGRLAAYYPSRFSALAFLAVGSGKPGREFDIDMIQQMTKKAVGFEMFGYISWMGGDEDPHSLLEAHAESAMSLLFAQDQNAWMKLFHPLGAMKQFVTEDHKLPVGKWYTPELQEKHLAAFGVKDGYKGATRWYHMLISNKSTPGEAAIADVNLQQPSVIVANGQSMAPQKQMLAEWVPNLTAKVLDCGHWTHIECGEQVSQTLDALIALL